MTRIRKILRNFFWPTATLSLLGAMAWSQSTLPHREEFDEFHTGAKAAVLAIPLEFGNYVGKEVALPEPDLQLLRPNVVRNISFHDMAPPGRGGGRGGSWGGIRADNPPVTLTIVQCRRIEDMIGHYPPICYPAFGDEEIGREERMWNVKGQSVRGTEYRFSGMTQDRQPYTRIVYNFMVVPGKGFVRDMDGLSKANNELSRRFYGAAQFQIIFAAMPGSELSKQHRDTIFTQVIQQAMPAITTLSTDRTGKTSDIAIRAVRQQMEDKTVATSVDE